MISYDVYRLFHFAGIFMVLSAFGGMAIHRVNGGSREDFPARRLTAMIHGLGLFLVILGGFGMYARLYGGMSLPGWVYIKLLIWLLLGGVPALLLRVQSGAKALLFATIALALAAGIVARTKPFSPTAPEAHELGIGTDEEVDDDMEDGSNDGINNDMDDDLQDEEDEMSPDPNDEKDPLEEEDASSSADSV